MNEVEYIRVSALTEVINALSCLSNKNADICEDVDQEKLSLVRMNLQDIRRALYDATIDLVEGDG